MPYLFDHLDVVEKVLRRSPFGLMADVDGTISRTAPTPQQAEISPKVRQHLYTLSQRLALVAAISGRPVIEVENMLKLDGVVYIGNHGLERLRRGHLNLVEEAHDYLQIIQTVIAELAPLLSTKGIKLENKGATATVHYRLASDPERARREILDGLDNLTQAKGLLIQPGRMAINLLPPVKANKGTAVTELIQEYQLHGGVYLGDDFTDIDAFRAIRAASINSDFQGFAVGIISQEIPEMLVAETDFTVKETDDVERLLDWLSRTVPQSG